MCVQLKSGQKEEKICLCHALCRFWERDNTSFRKSRFKSWPRCTEAWMNCVGLRTSVSCSWAVSPASAKLCVQRRVALGPCQTVLVQSSSSRGMVLVERVGCERSHLPHRLWAGPVPIRAPLGMHNALNCLCMRFLANLMLLVYFISLTHC